MINIDSESEEKINLQDWQKIHPNFTPELQSKWEERGLDYLQTKCWIDFAGLKLEDAKFAYWLKKRAHSGHWVFSCNDIESLRDEYNKNHLEKLENWISVHPDFTKELIAGWEKWDFIPEECQDWISAGLAINEAQLAKWLENQDYLSKKERRSEYSRGGKQKVFDLAEKESLRAEYLNSWGDIHLDFAKKDYFGRTNQQYWEESSLTRQDAQEWIEAGFEPKHYEEMQNWKNRSFTAQQTQSWIKAGLEKKEADFAIYFQDQGYTYENAFQDENKTRIWLDWQYPLEKRKRIIKLDISNKFLSGSLDLNDFINLEKLNFSLNKITSLNVNKCTNLKTIICNNNQLTSLDCSNCEKLTTLSCYNNQLTTLLLKGKEKLTHLNANNNQLADLTIFSHLVNLKTLYLGNNPVWKELENYPGNAVEKLKYWRKDQLIKDLETEQTKIPTLEEEILRLTNLIKKQKEKIVEAYLYSFAKEEKLLVKELIESHLELTRIKKQRLSSTKQEREYLKLKLKVLDNLTEEVFEKVQLILTDCEDLVNLEIELWKEISKNQQMLEETKQQINHYITYINAPINVNQGNVIIGSSFGDNVDFSQNKTITYTATEGSFINAERAMINLKGKNNLFNLGSNQIRERDWTNINHEFANQALINQWKNQGFTYQTTQEWINIDLNPSDSQFARYLITNNWTPERALNQGNLAQLRIEFTQSKLKEESKPQLVTEKPSLVIPEITIINKTSQESLEIERITTLPQTTTPLPKSQRIKHWLGKKKDNLMSKLTKNDNKEKAVNQTLISQEELQLVAQVKQIAN